jgi:predicted permease
MIVLHYALLSAPLFGMVLLGYLLASWSGWQERWTALLSKLVMAVILPALLFHTMSDLHSLPPVNARLLIAFFGGCFIVFLSSRWLAARYFKLDEPAQSVFAMGAIFSNNVLLGLPMARRRSASSRCLPLRSSSCSTRLRCGRSCPSPSNGRSIDRSHRRGSRR